MSREKFDPKKMRARAERPASDALPGLNPQTSQRQDVLSVSQLAARIDSSLRAGFPASVRVIGEVSGFRERTHWYFDLKDADSIVNAVMFASSARKAGFTPAVGQEVVATGRVEFYAKGGKVTLLVERLDAVGAGALELQFRALCEEIRALGWFDARRKRPIPTFPRRVAVVTSRTGAALQDVLVTMQKRCPAVGVLVADTRVQGEGAAAEIAATIDTLSARAKELGLDAILVTRGGGSMEDLWAFNEKAVARAIVECSVPVVAAIGHETDTTIAELVADERGATPTQAAMRLTPDSAALEQQLDALRRRLAASLRRAVELRAQRLQAARRHRIFANPRELVARAGERALTARDSLDDAAASRLREARHRVEKLAQRLGACRPDRVHARTLARLDGLTSRLAAATRSALARSSDTALALERQLRAVAPVHVLERGYSITLLDSGRAVRSIADAKTGDTLRTVLADGSLRSLVQGGPTPRPLRKPRKPTDDGPGLFSA